MSISVLGTLKTHFLTILLEFLNQPNEDYEPVAIHKTRMFYETCLQHIGM
jgi:hypothetical protein